MYLHIEEPARVREEREYMEHRDAHGPDAMRKKREKGGCGRTNQVDREMRRVQRCEFDRYESVEHLGSEEHTSELQSLMRITYAVFCLQNRKTDQTNTELH